MWHTVTKHALRAGTAACLALGVTIAAAPAWGRGEPNIKIGINRVILSGVSYTQQDTATLVSEGNASEYSGTDILFEWLASEHYSLEVTSTVTPLLRSYQLPASSGTLAANVNESASYTLIGANLYFSRATSRGMQYLMGVSTGTVAVGHAFEGGSMGTLTTTNTVPVSAIRFAVDWVTDLAGVRMQYQLYSGSTSNSTQVTGSRQTISFNGSAIGIGVYAFF